MIIEDLTTASAALFTKLALEARDWDDQPLLVLTAEERGNFSDLKRRGLVASDGEFALFTVAGAALASEIAGYQVEPHAA